MARIFWKQISLFFIFSFFASSCVGGTEHGTPPQVEAGENNETPVLNVMTHDSFSISEQVLNKFTEDSGIEVRFLKSGDTGTALNKAILSKDKPLADIFYGIDNAFLGRALEEGIFEKYESPLLAEIPDHFELDPLHRALPVDFGDVCLNYDKKYFSDHELQPPENLEHLLDPQFEGLLVVQNPATSSPGLAFLLATIGHFGEGEYLGYWEALVDNDLLVVNNWEIAYNQEFSRAGGTRPIVVSYGSSPPFEVIYSDPPVNEPPTAAVVSDGSCFRQVEFVGILSGTQNRELAEKWIDYMLSPTFQADIPLQMFVFPVNENTVLDETFDQYLSVPDKPAFVDPEEISKNREIWIKDWTEVVLR